MKGFFPDQSDHGAVTPFEYLPCGAITPKAGLALVLTNGLLAQRGRKRGHRIPAREDPPAEVRNVEVSRA